MTYLEFLHLNDFDRLTIETAVRCSEPLECDCVNWTWGNVKKVQDLLTDCETYEDILNVVKVGTNLDENSEARLILSSYMGIVKSIKEIEEMETNATAYQPTAKEIQASQSVGGFEMFGTLPQTLRLVGVVAPSVNEVNNTDYSICFAALAYTSRLNDFQKLVIK